MTKPKKTECPTCGLLLSTNRLNQHRSRIHNYKIPHGTKSRYDHGKCRCKKCRKANAAYMREYYGKNGRPSRAKNG